ncbi:type II secretion system protein N [Candidatus Thiothrix sp. Deng01]|uniref:Type II secretion system protein N n=1 Tax=Candidatus Thiothrix phosphatis TaxID=3112415 RepID=A0ABU6CUH3_9GAMM|nr:type II secretion system protein N [Candidatus Thiothrix sp. Deng01]MEB4590458.1 type II secretion system protein N [Candidatus Thiothrix sp. Deng01]
MKIRTLIFAGVGSFLLASFGQLPANLVLSKLPADAPVQLQGITGTLWQGGAETLRSQGTQINHLQWDLRLSPLLKGHLAAALRGKMAQGGKFDGICNINLAGAIRCAPLNLSDVPAQALAPYLQRFMVPPLSGTFQASLNNLEWDRQTLPHLSGHGEWREAGIQLAPQRFGTYSAILNAGADNAQQITLASAPDAAFTLDGAVTVQQNGHYQSQITLKPGNSIDDGTKQILTSFIGRPQADGGYLIQEQGQLPGIN